jgi:peptidoglycan hydrolase-like protein with peptidoglycan-binding domain
MHRRHNNHLATWLVGAIILVAGALGATSFLLLGANSHAPTAAATQDPTNPQGKPLLEMVTAASPSPGASGVSPDTLISLKLSAPLASNSPMPRLSPPVAGSWNLSTPTVLVFQPRTTFVPGANESVIVPAGDKGLLGTDGERTTDTLTVGFHVAGGSTLRLQQILAELGYLPLSFKPASSDPVNPLYEAVPQVGTFAWRWSGLPSSLTSLWSPGTANVITQGAIMQFENFEGLATDGIAGPVVWTDLLHALWQHKSNPLPYDYVYVQKNPEPETVTVFRNGTPIYTTDANTGIAVAPTPSGTWPVYVRYTVTTMSGTNPDGSHYSDPGIPWVSYFYGGDALHGFLRPGYGYPQSLGCVEMPYANAAVVYPLTPIGTLVTVQ